MTKEKPRKPAFEIYVWIGHRDYTVKGIVTTCDSAEEAICSLLEKRMVPFASMVQAFLIPEYEQSALLLWGVQIPDLCAKVAVPVSSPFSCVDGRMVYAEWAKGDGPRTHSPIR